MDDLMRYPGYVELAVAMQFVSLRLYRMAMMGAWLRDQGGRA